MENGNGHHGVSVREAAKTLGISPRAVRFRLQKKQLSGAFLDGQWMVFLGAEINPGESVEADEVAGNFRATDYPGNGNGVYQSTAPVTQPFQAVMTEWVSPLVEKISVQSEEIGKLKAEKQRLEEENAALKDAIMGLDGEPENDKPKGFWARLFGL